MGNTNWNTDAGRVGEQAFVGVDQLAKSLAAFAEALGADAAEGALVIQGGDTILQRVFDGDGAVPDIWSMSTTDLSADVDTTGYLNEAAADLRVGAFIFSNTATAGTPSSGAFIVRTNTGGIVDVSNISSFGLANTD